MVPESAGASFPGDWKTDAQGFLLGAEMGGDAAVGAAPGVFAAGCAKRPAGVSDSVKDVTGTVLKAIQAARR
jgi:heterodisulfide reductase subunit A-like polyferredoxin